jgi:hypothetical protein
MNTRAKPQARNSESAPGALERNANGQTSEQVDVFIEPSKG